jgi:glutamyl-tRNA synthetase
VDIDEKAQQHLGIVSNGILNELTPHLQSASWDRDALEAAVGRVMETQDIGFGKVAGPLRAALAGRAQTPSVLDMMFVLGRDETLARLSDAVQE